MYVHRAGEGAIFLQTTAKVASAAAATAAAAAAVSVQSRGPLLLVRSVIGRYSRVRAP